jgi:hypothetical protein
MPSRRLPLPLDLVFFSLHKIEGVEFSVFLIAIALNSLVRRVGVELQVRGECVRLKPVDFHEFVNAIKELGVFWAIINEPRPRSVKKK